MEYNNNTGLLTGVTNENHQRSRNETSDVESGTITGILRCADNCFRVVKNWTFRHPFLAGVMSIFLITGGTTAALALTSLFTRRVIPLRHLNKSANIIIKQKLHNHISTITNFSSTKIGQGDCKKNTEIFQSVEDNSIQNQTFNYDDDYNDDYYDDLSSNENLPSPTLTQAELTRQQHMVAYTQHNLNTTVTANRAFMSKAYDESLLFIQNILSAAGINFFSQNATFEYGEYTCNTQNLLAFIPGNSTEVVIIGAHLDSVPFGSGANDNASGVAALLELILMLKDKVIEFVNPIIFAFWGGEEFGLGGSTFFVRNLETSLLNVTGVKNLNASCYINMDMLGSLNGTYFITDPIIPLTVNTGIIITPHNNSNILTAMLKQAFINIGITPTSCAFTGFSDYKWFAHAGIPSVALSTVAYTLTNPTSSFDTCYHQQCDDLNNVDLDMATNCTIAMFNLLKKLVTTQNFFNVE